MNTQTEAEINKLTHFLVNLDTLLQLETKKIYNHEDRSSTHFLRGMGMNIELPYVFNYCNTDYAVQLQKAIKPVVDEMRAVAKVKLKSLVDSEP